MASPAFRRPLFGARFDADASKAKHARWVSVPPTAAFTTGECASLVALLATRCTRGRRPRPPPARTAFGYTSLVAKFVERADVPHVGSERIVGGKLRAGGVERNGRSRVARCDGLRCPKLACCRSASSRRAPHRNVRASKD